MPIRMLEPKERNVTAYISFMYAVVHRKKLDFIYIFRHIDCYIQYLLFLSFGKFAAGIHYRT